ncbi:MAG: T9SS type A sorting domain-containing protein, partial [Saprospiraceae bacterium]
VLTGCVFENNNGQNYGGGIHNVSSSPVLTQCMFSDNIADEFGGGGMSSLNSFPVLNGCMFENNKSFLYGGAMLNDEGSSASITSCHFMGNIAIQGGGVYIRDDTTTTIHDSFFESNKAWGDGAGIEIWDSSPSIINCIFSGNKADLNGGAIAVQDNSDVHLINCVLSANRAGLRGGGIHNDGAGSIVITNATMSTNHADSIGGAIFNAQAAIIMTNSIIWRNSSGIETATIAASISNDTDAITQIGYSLVANAGGSASWNNEAGTDLGNNIDADPLFIQDGVIDTIPDPDMDLHLQELSSCINSGVTDTSGLGIPLVDIDGQPRIVQNRIDMGAYEYQELVYTHTVMQQNDWFVYPNPANEFTEVFGSGHFGQLVIYNLKGQIVFRSNDQTLDEMHGYHISIAQWPQGVYTIQLMEEGKAISSQKLVVVRE